MQRCTSIFASLPAYMSNSLLKCSLQCDKHSDYVHTAPCIGFMVYLCSLMHLHCTYRCSSASTVPAWHVRLLLRALASISSFHNKPALTLAAARVANRLLSQVQCWTMTCEVTWTLGQPGLILRWGRCRVTLVTAQLSPNLACACRCRTCMCRPSCGTAAL